MLAHQYQIYSLQSGQGLKNDFLAEVDFFLILEVPTETSLNLKESLHKIREDCLNTNIPNLAGFENFLHQEILKINLPASFSLAAILVKENLVYIKTYGQGEIYLKRRNKLVKLVSGEQAASGYLEKEDRLLLTTAVLSQHLQDDDSLANICSVKNLTDMNQKIETTLKRKNLDLIVLLINFHQPTSSKSFLSIFNGANFTLATTSRKKLLTLGLVVLLLIIFIWSVVFGHQRRTEAQQKAKILATNQEITKKLAEAADVSFLNNQKALSLINEARDSLDRLKSELGSNPNPEIDKIAAMIKDKENALLKKEEKPAEEYFDLKIDNKNATGTQMSLADDNLAILDKQNGAIYTLSLTKKSLTTSTVPEAKEADLLANQANSSFIFVKNSGIYRSDPTGKPKKVIENDSNWGQVNQLINYNNNLYLMDKNNSQIYKYVATDDGYASSSAYFKSGQAVDLTNANSLAINGSLYISLSDGIVKFTSGLRDGFKTNYPQENVQVNKIIADKNLESIIIWDKNQAALYILDKDGGYKKTINAAVLGKANDVVVYENRSYVLANNKIYKIDL